MSHVPVAVFLVKSIMMQVWQSIMLVEYETGCDMPSGGRIVRGMHIVYGFSHKLRTLYEIVTCCTVSSLKSCLCT